MALLIIIIILLLVLPLLYLQLRLQARAIRRLSESRNSGYIDDNTYMIWAGIIFFGGFIGSYYYLKQSGD